jgi:VCBS repeat-containing protein
MSILTGTNGDDEITGNNGVDIIYGGGGNDILRGGNGVDTLFGEEGNDQLFGDNGSDHLSGGADDDILDGLLGFDTAYFSSLIEEYTFVASAGYLHVIHLGGAGADGHDQLINVERLVFADRVIDIGSGHNRPVAMDDHVFITEDSGLYSSGAAGVLANDFDFDGDAMSVTSGTFTGTFGTLTLNADGTFSYALSAAAQALADGELAEDSFDYTVSDNDGSDTGRLVFNITGLNDAPVANPDTDTTGENAVLLVDVLANDEDVDNGALLTVIAASVPAGQGAASVVGNQVQFDPGTDFDSLAEGESVEVVVSYDIEDEHGATSSSIVTITLTGANDAPVANPDGDATGENGVLLVDVLANDTDVDNGAVLTVTAASTPAGQGTASIVGNQVQFDPGTDFDDLAVGETEEVELEYTIEDEHGATSSSTITIIVTGANDAPVAHPDTRSTTENSSVVIDVLANDQDVDNGALLTVTAASVPAGQGTATIVEHEVRFDPGTDFDYLASGETAVVILSYTIEDEFGATSSSTVTITVNGRDEGSTTAGTEGDDTLTGTPGDDTIDALGGDDTVFGLAGDDLITGGEGNDSLSGEEDNDTLEGGNGEDVLFGGEGDDQLVGEAGGDNLLGEGGQDQLSGGDGADFLNGGAGDDTIEGGNDEDFAFGDEGNDQLSGQAGGDILFGEAGDDELSGGADNDSLNGGEGDDSLDGGDGADSLSDLVGTNSFTGGLGQDEIVAGSTSGAQTIDGGGDDDTIVHYYRNFASTITTGAGSDTVELAYADQGSAAITVTDFTAGAGGDRFRLSGVDGALLSLLVGWDGSANPFGSSGFLQLVQSGSDTLLQWDQNGTDGGANWETLVVFENTDAGDFTDDNFIPGYHPDGSAPAGETITGTADADTLTGTIGNDTINALAGDDNVSGGAGSDQIDGGDGADFVEGGADEDVIAGGNDDDFLLGGSGHDQLSGQAGNDILLGEAGDDALSGGTENDTLNGGDGDDSLDGGDGADALSDLVGTNSFTGGIGQDEIIAGSADGAQTIDGGGDDDTIVHYFRHFASTITTGAGSDTIELAHADQGSAAITVTDFTAGAGGDRLRLSGADGALLSLLVGWDGSTNPFGSTGFLRLQQSGADTLLQWDQNGTDGGANWETLMVFENTDADDFTEANFVPAYNPNGDAPAGETINGTEDDDNLTGTVGGDTINALGGNDFVNGGAGGDTINGGDGLDFLDGGADSDVINAGNDDDFVFGGDGDDQLFGQAGNDSLFAGNGDDELSGGDGDDNLNGGVGDNLLVGGAGLDSIGGGDGADIFAFQAAADGPDDIIDFVSGTDTLRISAGGFGGGLTAGGTVSLVSGSTPTASGTNGQFLYDTDDGRLFWDADGTGTGGAVLIATLSSVPTITASDFTVI